MDSRRSVWLSTITLALACAGCMTTQNQSASSSITPASATANNAPRDEAVKPKKDGPKRNPMPRTEIAFGELKEKDADTELGAANPELQSRMREQARQAYHHALKIDPNYIDAYRHLGRLYTKIGDYDRAFETFKKAMSLQPKDASIWYDLGVCHGRRKDFDESVRCFQRALELDPENREYMKKLGFTLAWMGQTQQGLNHLIRAQGSAMANYNLGRVFLQRGQREQAQHYFTAAVRENPQMEPLVREVLGGHETPATPATASTQPAAPVAQP